ncbi:uncharacterized protein LOC119652391 isoform X2 [Hermetia illucens]|uniref:uncharacterized protein LOC119652391 isoform X2 n=1 Tax=Hermetia illucens TaxID=343691 RepID=UPI0018CC4089|nr:uncharacterized protein LOC119652391 isoform X2 [Hermetia illucens]
MKHHTLTSVAILLLALTYTVSAKDKYSDKEKYSDKNKIVIKEKDMLRKSIVFDKKTPDVFYCPMQKPSGLNKLIVRSRPLYKLCEFEGLPLPEDYKSDCYDDIDESDYACKEKYRIMQRIKLNEQQQSLTTSNHGEEA